MSLKSVASKVLNFIFGSKAGKELANVVISDTQAAVAVLKETNVGAAVANLIAVASTKGGSGASKFESVVAGTLPLIVDLLSKDGRRRTVDEVESIGRALVQTVFNDVKSSSSGSIASQIIALAKSLLR